MILFVNLVFFIKLKYISVSKVDIFNIVIKTQNLLLSWRDDKPNYLINNVSPKANESTDAIMCL